MLQDIEKKHRNEGLTLLAVSIDSPEDQPKIPAYLKKYGLDCRVLLAGNEGLEGYNFYAASSLFVVDRKGLLAGVPSQYYFKLEEELGRELPDLLSGRPTLGPVLWSLNIAPPGFGELWRVPEEAPVSDLTVVPASGKRAVEIGVLDESHHLKRYSGKGELLGDATLEDEKLWGLSGVDLDEDGVNEWVARNETRFQVLDAAGRSYWGYDTYDSEKTLEIGGFADLDGDGRKEILVRSGDAVMAIRNVPSLLWKNEALVDVKALKVDERKTIWVQTGDTVRRLDEAGRITGSSFQAPGSTAFLGELQPGSPRSLRAFGSRYSPVLRGGDLDGDGSKDILVRSRGGVTVYAQDGSVLLSLFVAENQTDAAVVLADLDGKPGDEMVIQIPHYGLVALGMKADQRHGTRASAGRSPR